MRLEHPAVPARGDRFVVRQYSPSRTIGGGAVIEPVASKRRRHHAEGLESLAVHESGSLEARLLQRLEGEARPASTQALAQALAEPVAEVERALVALAAGAEVAQPADGRWLAAARWADARGAIEREVRAYCERLPARYGIGKGELKSGLKGRMENVLFDAAFDALVGEQVLEQKGERVRPADSPWEPPAEMVAALEKLEADIEAEGFLVPDNAQWQAKLGAGAQEVAALGFFLGRLVRVNAELTYTARQMDDLKRRLATWFAKSEALTVADFRGFTGASRKYAVPLLEHCDRVGWTVRVGDERKRGGRG
jgi:selenocysteine-specific elongation factor